MYKKNICFRKIEVVYFVFSLVFFDFFNRFLVIFENNYFVNVIRVDLKIKYFLVDWWVYKSKINNVDN